MTLSDVLVIVIPDAYPRLLAAYLTRGTPLIIVCPRQPMPAFAALGRFAILAHLTLFCVPAVFVLFVHSSLALWRFSAVILQSL